MLSKQLYGYQASYKKQEQVLLSVESSEVAGSSTFSGHGLHLSKYSLI
jgi:hypothetical protein